MKGRKGYKKENEVLLSTDGDILQFLCAMATFLQSNATSSNGATGAFHNR